LKEVGQKVELKEAIFKAKKKKKIKKITAVMTTPSKQ
jgi:hypothetical protein